MSKYKHTHGRRAFLRGLGTLAVGLPLLELTHGEAWAAGTTVQKRFIVFFEHGGTIGNVNTQSWSPDGRTWIEDGTENHHGWNDWAPIDPGEALMLGPIHRELEAFKSKLIVPRGIDNATCVENGPYNGGHGATNVTILTANAFSHPNDSDWYALGPSIDQVVAERLGRVQPMPFETIHLRVAGHDYGTPFSRAANQPVSSEESPMAAFNSIFSGVGSGPTPDPEVVRARALKRSVLDGVLEGFNALRSRVSSYDKAILDAHFDHISALEARIRALEETGTCSPPTVTDDERAEVVGPLMADILVAALRCGLTQVGTLEVADIITSWLPTPFGPVGYDIGHSLHHHAGDVGKTGELYAKAADWREEMQINRRWRMSLVGRILQGLDEIPEGTGTMLDNSLLLATSEFSSGVLHSARDMPILLAGSAGGYFRTGRHLDFNTLKNAGARAST